MSADQITIRPALPDDAAGIVTVIRGCFAPALIDLFIYGCSGVARYVREQICAEAGGCDTTFDVAIADSRIVGTIEMRALPDRLFLNYVAVAPDVRSSLLGSRLLWAAFARVATPAHRLMALDVHEDNAVALQWYHGLGFVTRTTTEWLALPLSGTPGAAGGRVTGAPQAVVCHDAFGFSRVTVSTRTGCYEVGLLGPRWFRITTRAALEDAALVATLRAIDPARRVLALLPAADATTDAFPDARRITTTRRLTCDIDVLRARLTARLGSAPAMVRSGRDAGAPWSA